jgi:hypothetical protein
MRSHVDAFTYVVSMHAVVEPHVDSAALLRIDVPGTVLLIDDRRGPCGHRQ